ncbi:hypothetical protein IW262DRAFT_1528554 [Armillaria fumosa]|nr:hypothetical protein IW262DRAFT_1528554 [Armillaria fumosa]
MPLNRRKYQIKANYDDLGFGLATSQTFNVVPGGSGGNIVSSSCFPTQSVKSTANGPSIGGVLATCLRKWGASFHTSTEAQELGPPSITPSEIIPGLNFPSPKTPEMMPYVEGESQRAVEGSGTGNLTEDDRERRYNPDMCLDIDASESERREGREGPPSAFHGVVAEVGRFRSSLRKEKYGGFKAMHSNRLQSTHQERPWHNTTTTTLFRGETVMM